MKEKKLQTNITEIQITEKKSIRTVICQQSAQCRRTGQISRNIHLP